MVELSTDLGRLIETLIVIKVYQLACPSLYNGVRSFRLSENFMRKYAQHVFAVYKTYKPDITDLFQSDSIDLSCLSPHSGTA